MRLGHLTTMLVVAGATPAAGQEFANFGGFEGRIGLAAPVDATAGLSGLLEADLGYLTAPQFRVLAGLETYHAGQDRVIAGTKVTGSYRGTGAHLGIRWDVTRQGQLMPYLTAGLLGEDISADVNDPATRDLLSGFGVGLELGGGLARAFDPNGNYWATAHVSRVFMRNASRWNIQLGLRWMLRGRGLKPDDHPGGAANPPPPSNPQPSNAPAPANPQPANPPAPSNAPPPAVPPASGTPTPPSAVPPSAVPPSGLSASFVWPSQ
jgi:hypothetical protein